MYTGSYLVAQYLMKCSNIKTIFLIGMEALKNEIEEKGIKVIGNEYNGKSFNAEEFRNISSENKVDAIVIY